MTVAPTIIFHTAVTTIETIMFYKKFTLKTSGCYKRSGIGACTIASLLMTMLKNLFQYFQLFNFSIVNSDISVAYFKEFEDEANN